jgi:hypothetical protein
MGIDAMQELPLNTSAASIGHEEIATEDRRQSERTTLDDTVKTAILRESPNPQGHLVRIVNVSPEGLGVFLDEIDPPSVGSTVAVEYHGIVRPATVRWVLRKRDLGWQIGLHWQDLEWTL